MYILRSDGDKNIVIAGKTADGLDAAVRKYANAVDLGKSTLFDITYHEGYRVEKAYSLLATTFPNTR